jgi:hypothetical protein
MASRMLRLPFLACRQEGIYRKEVVLVYSPGQCQSFRINTTSQERPDKRSSPINTPNEEEFPCPHLKKDIMTHQPREKERRTQQLLKHLRGEAFLRFDLIHFIHAPERGFPTGPSHVPFISQSHAPINSTLSPFHMHPPTHLRPYLPEL